MPHYRIHILGRVLAELRALGPVDALKPEALAADVERVAVDDAGEAVNRPGR